MKIRYSRIVHLLLLTAVLCGSLVLFSTAMPDSVVPSQRGKGISAEALHERIGETVSVLAVYSRDDFAAAAAERVRQSLSEAGNFRTEVLSDADYADGEHSADLTLFLGHTEISSESYLDAVCRLGTDGLEITHAENAEGETDRLFLLAFSEEQLNRAVDRFLSYFLSVSRIYKAFSTLYASEPGRIAAELPEEITLKDSRFVAAVSYPAADEYSLNALRTLLSVTSPDAILFEGGLDCGESRGELSDSWSRIISVCGDADLSVNASPDPEDAGNGRIAAEVAVSLGGEREILNTEKRTVLYTDSERRPAAALFICGASNIQEAKEEGEQIQEVLDLARRAAGREIPAVAILPFLPSLAEDAIAEVLRTEPDSTDFSFEADLRFSRPWADPLYRLARAAGVANFVFCCGPLSAGTVSVTEGDEEIRYGLCGSVDFNAPGLGGRFALNNSLRGLLGIDLETDGKETEIKITYFYARDWGLTEKNVG